MSDQPKISVVCPTFNSENFIIKTLDSVFSQTVQPQEIIIIDDGSNDKTVPTIETYFKNNQESIIHSVLIKNCHQGPGAARNAGIRAATCDWIAFIDSDDLWHPNKIEEVSKAIQNHPETNFIFHNEDRLKIDQTKSMLHDFGAFFNYDQPLTLQLWRGCIFHTSAITCQRECLLKAGLFNEKLMSSQDWELWIRMSHNIHYHYIRKELGVYVDRPGSITMTKSYRGLLNELKILHMHRTNVGAGIIEFIYRAMRRIAGRLGRDIGLLDGALRKTDK